ncbi:amino acid ABC transporter permease [Citreimonas salinaria]|uniref:L-glutamine ABC transporter membrane protein /L-glutamate ABC transporter membrane protein /L-aspartate ABC transporter membrane protein /L-asparagine ABC transporter membrane protein n=1 Tax=Citreimonas salinaria TaxID=321339 RepID=A0A1H3KHU8_9RHOB|nr:ABC transporter permease subunit [Citreimonas salinaria]SDY51703.1 L-glutamine ABC transporter membrane protein /L-glutamate ABC transporter membrane protein /L-aspartate ABC transporter membrane protein /L-asparagine ABC transporter membrane protein [Citreimonas salinaria]
MATLSDPPSESFQLSKLIRDTRYRSYTFQLIALIALILVFAYLGSNLASNLAEAGLNISFSFLGNSAGYDINQSLIEYNNQMTHLRATLVGALNTLLVAFLGCILATIIGVIVGVLRLSKNWLIGRIMSIYVEIFRNVPVLIWILIIYFVMTAAMPSARDYLGEEPERDLLLGLIAFTNRGVYVPAAVFQPMGWVVLGVFVASIFGAIAYRRYATKLLYDTGRLLPMGWPMLAIVILPALVAFFVLGQPIALDRPDPLANRFNLQGGIPISGAFIALWFALSIYTAAFIAENVRAGILAVSRGQTEAAASLGLRPNRIMNLVVLPQALRVIIPPVISQYLNLTKNSSLAIAVGYMDLTATLGGITLNQTGRAIECILLLMLFYLAISLAISAVMNAYNSAIRLKER